MPTTLRASDLTLAWGDHVVVHEASLDIVPGQVTALVGPNGTGKSTLLRAMAKLHPINSGTLSIVTDSDQTPASHFRGRSWARTLAMLTQHRPVPAGVSVHEAVGFGRHPHRRRLLGVDPEGAKVISDCLRMTGLSELAESGVDQLSGGQQQRVWLAGCLAQQTPVLLLDEPTNHLDLRHQVELLDVLRDLAQFHSVAVGVVLHDLNQAAAVADRVALLSQGRLLATGDPDKVLTAALLSQAYGVEVTVGDDAEGMSISALHRLCRRPRTRPAIALAQAS